MLNTHAITLDRHASRRWRRPTSYAFAAELPLVPLAGFEVAKAAACLPLAFLQNGDGWLPAAVLGVPPSTNYCVASDGRWMGPHIPAVLRSYPFALRHTADGRGVLCIDEDSGLVSAGTEGERFFTEEGKATETITAILNEMIRMEQSREAGARAAAVLYEHGLLTPKPLNVQVDTVARSLGGLFQINEQALTQLPPEALHSVMQAGGLALAYAQLLSLQHFDRLVVWARAHTAAPAPAPVTAPQTPPAPDLDLVQKFFEPGAPDTIQFNW